VSIADSPAPYPTFLPFAQKPLPKFLLPFCNTVARRISSVLCLPSFPVLFASVFTPTLLRAFLPAFHTRNVFCVVSFPRGEFLPGGENQPVDFFSRRYLLLTGSPDT